MKTSLEYFLTRPETILERRQGPIAGYLEQYAQCLYELKYGWRTGRYHLCVLGQFNDWLAKRKLTAREVTPILSRQFLRWRRQRIQGQSEDALIVSRLLELISPPAQEVMQQVATCPAEQILRDYRGWLEQERGLAQATVVTYMPYVRRFLAEQFGRDQIDFAQLTPASVIGFVQKSIQQLKSAAGMQLQITALRSFLRHLLVQGNITANLAACIPAVANWSLSNVPKFLSSEQVRKTLDSCDRESAYGKRNYAILLLLARLGLRAGEIVLLTLDDIDWEQGLITLHGKGKRIVQMPLPSDVGEAIAAYVRFGRPECGSCRRVFIRNYAPLVGFASSASISSIVAQALRQANVQSVRRGAHLFRHSLATRMINSGSSLAEVGEVLRHRDPDTTRIYAKVDLVTLRTIAQAWPGGAL
jgi:site-specific recombinase XerD